jgi:hypothetical protein
MQIFGRGKRRSGSRRFGFTEDFEDVKAEF